MVEWLAGNRIIGTTAERPALGLPSGSVGGWVEVARTTLGSNGNTFTVSSIPDKRYYFVLINPAFTNAGSGNTFRLGSGGSEDSGSNYAYRRSTNGGSDVTGINQSSGIIPIGGYSTEHELLTMHIANKSDKEKLCIHNRCYSIAGAGNAPLRIEQASKWTNTSNAIDMMKATLNSSGNFASGTEIVVLGYDPADTHTTNFWEELSSVTTTSSGTISSGTITAKKYLMYQIIGKKASGTGTGSSRFQFNGDTGSNYAQRNSINGTHYTYGSQASANIGGDGNTAGEMVMYTGFIINNASTEKLWLGFSAFGNSSGNNIGNKGEIFDKWANTSDQITSILCMNMNFDAGAKMTIWGSD